MSKVWLTIPSARPASEVNARIDQWQAMGYAVALWRDEQYAPEGAYVIDSTKIPSDFHCDLMIVSKTYPGYAVACNTLIHKVLERDPGCDWCVCAGDDTYPDPTKRAEEIAAECSAHFTQFVNGEGWRHRTFGVMQATGDRWQDTPASRAMYGENRGALIDRVAGSPFIGREFALRILQGKGPYYPQMKHMFVDECLQHVAEKYGVFWQRRDLTHYHAHAQRTEGVEIGPAKPLPPHMVQWNTRQHWDESKAEFERLKAAGWPGSEPL